LTGTPYSSFTYQRNPSDPTINPSPTSMSCVFFTELKSFVALSWQLPLTPKRFQTGYRTVLRWGRITTPGTESVELPIYFLNVTEFF